jgi:excisionase family DNA binding protein
MAYERERRFTVNVAADRLGIADRTLRAWIKEKLIRAVRTNPARKRSPWLVSEREIERIEAQRQAG